MKVCYRSNPEDAPPYQPGDPEWTVQGQGYGGIWSNHGATLEVGSSDQEATKETEESDDEVPAA